MSKPSLGAGNVDIELAGETVTLRPTLKAAQTISRQGGGIMGAVDRVTRFDLDALTAVVASGLDKPAKDVAESVWRAGCSTLAPSVIKYLGMLANGGRPAGEPGGEGETDPLSS